MYILWTTILAAFLAQFLKLIISFIRDKKLNFRRLVEPGGMPSAHTAFVTSLATAVGIAEGFDSVLFSVCSVVALIIMYDATNLRRAVGRQARVLNKIMEELETATLNEGKLKELLGHTPKEVLFGAFLGICIALIFR